MTALDILITVLAVILGAGPWVVWGFQKRRKPDSHPYHATLELAPGKSTLDLVNFGVKRHSVVLTEVVMDLYGGTTVTFVDLTHFMEHRRVSDADFDY